MVHEIILTSVPRNKTEKGDGECWGEEHHSFKELIREVSLS